MLVSSQRGESALEQRPKVSAIGDDCGRAEPGDSTWSSRGSNRNGYEPSKTPTLEGDDLGKRPAITTDVGLADGVTDANHGEEWLPPHSFFGAHDQSPVAIGRSGFFAVTDRKP